MTADGQGSGADVAPGSPDEYLTLHSFQTDEIIIKRSRFIGWGTPVDSEEAALAVIERIRAEHPQATHHCYAYRAGLTSETVRFNDDGEPTGTAGRPILEVLQREGLQNALVVVTRYYGGTPLGAAGLVRAYAQTAKLAVDAAGVVRRQLHTRMGCQVDYDAFGRIQHALLERGVHLEDVDYGERVGLRLVVRKGGEDEVRALLGELTNGQAEPRELARLYWPPAKDNG